MTYLHQALKQLGTVIETGTLPQPLKTRLGRIKKLLEQEFEMKNCERCGTRFEAKNRQNRFCAPCRRGGRHFNLDLIRHWDFDIGLSRWRRPGTREWLTTEAALRLARTLPHPD